MSLVAVYDALKAANVDDAKATAAVEALEANRDEYRLRKIETRLDNVGKEIGDLRVQMEKQNADLRSEIAEARTDMEKQNADLRSEIAGVRTDIEKQNAALRSEIAEMRAEMEGRFSRLEASNKMMFVLVLAVFIEGAALFLQMLMG